MASLERTNKWLKEAETNVNGLKDKLTELGNKRAQIREITSIFNELNTEIGKDEANLSRYTTEFNNLGNTYKKVLADIKGDKLDNDSLKDFIDKAKDLKSNLDVTSVKDYDKEITRLSKDILELAKSNDAIRLSFDISEKSIAALISSYTRLSELQKLASSNNLSIKVDTNELNNTLNILEEIKKYASGDEAATKFFDIRDNKNLVSGLHEGLFDKALESQSKLLQSGGITDKDISIINNNVFETTKKIKEELGLIKPNIIIDTQQVKEQIEEVKPEVKVTAVVDKVETQDKKEIATETKAQATDSNIITPKIDEKSKIDDIYNNLVKQVEAYGKMFNVVDDKLLGYISKNVEYDQDLNDDQYGAGLSNKIKYTISTYNAFRKELDNIDLSSGNVESLRSEVSDIENKYLSLIGDFELAIKNIISTMNNVLYTGQSDISSVSVNENTGALKGELNTKYNELETNRKQYLDINDTTLDKYPQAYNEFIDNFKKTLDQVEYAEGRLTEFGKVRSDLDLSTGFTVDEKDVANMKDVIQQQINEIKDKVKISEGFDLEGIKQTAEFLGQSFDEALQEALQDKATLAAYNYDFSSEDFKQSYGNEAETIERLEKRFNELDNAIGRKIKGYAELYEQLSTQIKNINDIIDITSKLVTPVGEEVLKETIGDIRTQSITETISKSKEADKDPTKIIKAYGIKDAEEAFNIKTSLESQFGKVSESFDTSKMKSFKEALDEIIADEEAIKNIDLNSLLSREIDANSIKTVRNEVDRLTRELTDISNLKIVNGEPIKLNLESGADKARLNEYTNQIVAATEMLKNLQKEQENTFKKLDFSTDINKYATSAFNIDDIKYIQSVLGSGLKINIDEGSKTKELLNNLKVGFEDLVNKAGSYNIKAISDEEITNGLRLAEIEKQIGQEKAHNIEKDKFIGKLSETNNKYVDTSNELLQKQANLKAINLIYTTRLASASNKLQRTEVETFKGEALKKYVGNISLLSSTIKDLNKQYDRFGVSTPKIDTIPKTPKIGKDLLKEYNTYRFEGLINARKQINELGVKFNDLSNEANKSNVNIDKILGRLAAIKSTAQSALYSGDLNKINTLLAEYNRQIEIGQNKVTGANKAKEIGYKREQDSIRALLEETKNYVSTQEILNNKPMSGADQAAYYTQQLAKFKQGTQEYIVVLNLKQQAERKAAEEAQKAAEEEKRAQLDAVNTARDRVNSVLSFMKSLADGVNSAVNKIVSILRTGISIINKVFSTIGKFIGSIGGGIKSIIMLFGNLGNRVKQSFGLVDKNGRSILNVFNLMNSASNLLRTGINKLKTAFNLLFNNQMVSQAKNLMASVYSMKNIMGTEMTQSVLDWANSMEHAFGLSARELIGDINELTGVLYGLGMTAQDVAIGSENLLMISRYLGFMGAAGGNVEQVMTKLTSGMKGMTQAIDDLGLSVREAQMDTFLKKIKAQGGEFANISTSFSSLNEQARVYVRYAALIDQFTNSYNLITFADALDTVTGRLSLLSQAFKSLTAVAGTGLAKIGAYIAGYLIPIIVKLQHYVEMLFTWLGGLLGIDLDTSLNVNINGDDKVDDLNSSLKDTNKELENVSENTKKASGNLQSFDRILNVSSSKSDSGSGADKDSFDYSKLMNTALTDLNAYADAADSYFDKLNQNLEDKLRELRDRLNEFAKGITGRADFDLGFNWDAIKANLITIKDNVLAFIKSWGKFTIEIAFKLADDLNIGLIITKLTELVAKATEVANRISEVLQPALDTFYEHGIRPIAEALGVETVNLIDFLIIKLEELAKWFEDNKELINTWAADVGDKVAQAFRVLTGDRTLEDAVTLSRDDGWAIFLNILASVNDTVNNLISGFGQLLDILVDGVPTLDTYTEMQSGSTWGDILIIIQSLREIILELIDDLIQFVGNEGLEWLKSTIKEIAEFVSTHKEEIVSLIETIANIAWESFKTFVDLVIKLIEFVVEHPDVVIMFFKGLLALKVASWFLSIISQIGMFLMGIVNLTNALPQLLSLFSSLGSTLASSGIGQFFAGLASAGIGALAAKIAVVIGVVLALVSAFKDLWDTSETFRTSFESMGEVISKAWEKLTSIFKGGDEESNEPTRFDKLKESLSELGKTLYTIYENTLKPVLSILFRIIGVLGTGVIVTIIDAITAVLNTLIDVVTGAINILNGLLDVIIGIFTLDPERIKEGLGGILEGIGGLIQGIFDLAGGVVDALGNLVSTIIGAIAEAFVSGMGSGIQDSWDKTWDNIKKWCSDLLAKIKDFFGIHSPSTVFADIGNNLVLGLVDGIKKSIDSAITSIKEAFGKITEGITDVFNGLKDKVTTIFNDTKEAAVKAWDNIKEKFNTVKENITTVFNETKDKITEAFNTAKTNVTSGWESVKSTFSSISSSIASGFESMKSRITKVFDDVKSKIKDTMDNIKEDVNDWVDNTKEKTKKVIEDTKETANKAYDYAKDKADSVKSYVSEKYEQGKDFLEDKYNKLTGRTSARKASKITKHAVGGSIAGGQLFIANENGEPELIGNIDKTGKTNVANNNMIIEAMSDAMFTGVYNAIAEASNQRTQSPRMNQDATIKIDGFGLIDGSTLSELARLLAPYLNSNNMNIADVNFSI